MSIAFKISRNLIINPPVIKYGGYEHDLHLDVAADASVHTTTSCVYYTGGYPFKRKLVSKHRAVCTIV